MRIMKAQKPLVDKTFYSKICSLRQLLKLSSVKSSIQKAKASKETADQEPQVRLEESQNAEIKYQYKEVVKGEEWKT